MGADVRFGDLRDPASVDAACEGIDTVLSTASAVSRGGDDTIDAVDDSGTRLLFETAVARGARRAVYVSAAGADGSSPVPLLAAKGRTEARLRELDAEWTVLAPSPFMETAIGPLIGRAVATSSPLAIPGGDTRYRFVAEHDVAMACVAALSSTTVDRRRILVHGPEAYSWRDVVTACEGVLGRSLATTPVDDSVAGEEMSPLVRARLSGAVDEVADDEASAASMLGVTPTTLENWVRAAVAMTRRRV